MRLLFIATTVLFSVAAYAQNVFLDGFPDVPVLEGVSEIPDERVVFDTPAGTVAQTALITQSSTEQALAQYSSALVAFGWQCEQTGLQMTCGRDESKLLFKGQRQDNKTGRIILRLEPAQ